MYILCTRHIPGCLNVMADSMLRSTIIQLTEFFPHPKVFKHFCQMWFTPHIDLFATRLNHKVPLYLSPGPDQQAWKIDALNKDWSVLMGYAYLPIALLYMVIQKCVNTIVSSSYKPQAGQRCPGFGTQCSSQWKSQFSCHHRQPYSSSVTTKCSTTIDGTSAFMSGF